MPSVSMAITQPKLTNLDTRFRVGPHAALCRQTQGHVIDQNRLVAYIAPPGVGDGRIGRGLIKWNNCKVVLLEVVFEKWEHVSDVINSQLRYQLDL